MIILKSIGKCRAFCVLQIWANELGLGMILLACRAPQRLCCRKMLHVARCAHSGVCMLQNNCTQVTKCRISLTLGTSNWCSRPSRVDTWTSRISSLWSFQERLWVFAPEKKAQRGSDTAGGHTAQPGGGGADCKPQGCSHSLKLWPFSRQVDRGAALAGEQSLSFRLQLARGRVPSSFSSGPRGEHRVHSFAAGVGGHRQVSTVLDAMDYDKHRVGAG